jgi:hypothetical protein
MMSLRSAISFYLFTISVSFQSFDFAQDREPVERPFDSPQGREPVENPELVEVVERPF